MVYSNNTYVLVVTNENYHHQYLDNAYMNPTALPAYNPKFWQKITRQQTIKKSIRLYKDQRLREKKSNNNNYTQINFLCAVQINSTKAVTYNR